MVNGFNDIKEIIKKELDTINKKQSVKLSEKEEKKCWKVLSGFGPFLTSYGKKVLDEDGFIETGDGFGVSLKQSEVGSFEDYGARFYVNAFRGNSKLDFISLSGKLKGVAKLEIFAQNEDYRRPVVEEIVALNGDEFILPKVALSEILIGESLYLEVTAISDIELTEVNWIGANRSENINSGLRVVLIRTFGNKNIVQENLERLTKYLKGNNIYFRNYSFIVYDATGVNDPLEVDDNINCIYINGGNYGGGGNASVLGAALIAASEELPDVKIDEIILWDDDAVIEPQSFVRHDGFVAFRNDNIAHTGIVLSKTSPNVIQEYGALWGAFFDQETTQISLKQSTNTHMFPYLVRHGREIDNEWDRVYLGNNQDIDFGTFIYLSLPFNLLKKVKGTMPFFLRNDDVEIGLRIKDAGGKLIVNPAIAAWHEATHNVVSEFYATFHGYIINAAYFNFEKNWAIKGLMQRALGASSVKNTALLEAYINAIKCFIAGPEWMKQPDVYKNYLVISGKIGAHLRNYRQIPFEVIDMQKQQGRAEVHVITNPFVKQVNNEANIIFYDAPTNRYLQVSLNETAKEPELFAELVILIAELNSCFDEKCKEWRDFVIEFDAVKYWESFYTNSGETISAGKIKKPAYGEYVATKEAYKNINATKKTFKSTLKKQVSSIKKALVGKKVNGPEDFNPVAYYKFNPDVEAAGIDALEHYLEHGLSEGRRYK